MSEEKRKIRRHSPEFRTEIARRMLAGEDVTAMSQAYGLARSMMYRWRDAYRKEGIAGVSRPPGVRCTPATKKPDSRTEERLRKKVAELERKLGQQEMEVDFFRGVFKRLEELPKAKRRGSEASTGKSAE
jgi:transposase-like protein